MIKNFRMSRKVFAWPYILFMLLFIVTPLVIVLVNAFLADGKLTLDNFVDFFRTEAVWTCWQSALSWDL